jgi:hypothetical protein
MFPMSLDDLTSLTPVKSIFVQYTVHIQHYRYILNNFLETKLSYCMIYEYSSLGPIYCGIDSTVRVAAIHTVPKAFSMHETLPKLPGKISKTTWKY